MTFTTFLPLWFAFVFQATATTEIYTYVHSLSLHGALPIWAAGHSQCSRAVARRPERGLRAQGRGPDAATRPPGQVRFGILRGSGRQIGRAPSELQSLMRTSYADF